MTIIHPLTEHYVTCFNRVEEKKSIEGAVIHLVEIELYNGQFKITYLTAEEVNLLAQAILKTTYGMDRITPPWTSMITSLNEQQLLHARYILSKQFD